MVLLALPPGAVIGGGITDQQNTPGAPTDLLNRKAIGIPSVVEETSTTKAPTPSSSTTEAKPVETGPRHYEVANKPWFGGVHIDLPNIKFSKENEGAEVLYRELLRVVAGQYLGYKGSNKSEEIAAAEQKAEQYVKDRNGVLAEFVVPRAFGEKDSFPLLEPSDVPQTVDLKKGILFKVGDLKYELRHNYPSSTGSPNRTVNGTGLIHTGGDDVSYDGSPLKAAFGVQDQQLTIALTQGMLNIWPDTPGAPNTGDKYTLAGISDITQDFFELTGLIKRESTRTNSNWFEDVTINRDSYKVSNPITITQKKNYRQSTNGKYTSTLFDFIQAPRR